MGRLGQFLDKVFDRPRSASPSGTRSLVGATGGTPLKISASLRNYQLIKERHQAIQHEGLKQSISNLIGFLEVEQGSLETTILSKLDSEIKELSEIIAFLSENNGSVSSQKQSEDFATEIDAAIKRAQSMTSDPSKRSLSLKLDRVGAVSHITESLHMAIENYQSLGPSRISLHAPKKTAREISGRVVGALAIVKEMLDGVPVPGLKAAVGGLLEVLGAINKLIDNDDDLIKLIDHLQRLLRILTKPIEDGKNGQNTSLEQRIEDLIENIQRITADATKIKEQNLSNRFLGRGDNASAITGLSTAIDRAVDRFQVSGAVDIERDIGKMKLDIGVIGKGVLSEFEERALNAIQPRADSARYDSASQSSSSFCLEDTRVKLLDEIEQWAEDPNSRPIFWLCGMAGTGKSTIARTVAKRFNERHCLGASFFFSRDEDDRRTANLVFPTIAYQLARRISSLREHILKAATPDVCTAMMRTQLNELIVEPFQNSTFQCSTLVIVIDALDECVKESQITEMLVLLAPAIRSIQNTVNIKLFLTSRPEVHISSEFGEPGMEAVSSVSILHDIEKSLVRSDIGRYVDHHLQRIAKVILPRHVVWPTLKEKETLIDLADGLFIFAAVTIAYIGDAKHRQPKQRLRDILSASAQNQVSVPLVHLDILYRQILMASLPDDDKGEDNQHLKLRICEILGTVVLLLCPLSSRWLEKLLNWEEDTVEPTLGGFHSVLSIPSSPTAIRAFHKSFPDFLTDKRRSGEFWFHIDPNEHHTRLALICLTHMNTSLHRDMCDVGNSLVSDLDVETILQTKVEGHILYACRYWAVHLKEAGWTDGLGAALKYFCEHKILYWLEISCLDRRLSAAILALDSAREWTLDDRSSTMLANSYRYLLYYRNIISLGPSHIYQSTLPFVPRRNLSSSPWERELHRSPRVIMREDDDTWDRILFTLTGHSGDVNAVAYSPDGGLLASGSDDEKVIIWDSRTGAQIHSLEGHLGQVLAVDFSPNDKLIASGSSDQSVCIWSSVTGVLIHTLNGHTKAVTAVSFSPLGTVVASGSTDETVILWDSENGSVLRILSGASSSLWGIRFSPDGTQIFAPSSDSDIIIWDIETETIQSRLQSRFTIYSIAFSPDGTLLASASREEVILWDYKSPIILRKLEGEAYSVTFSRDGRFIATGKHNGQIVTWDITSGSQIGAFGGHTKLVRSLAVSPDGSRIISGSYDHTAAVWDMKSGWESPGESDNKVHKRAVHCVAFSSDGKTLASGGEDAIVAVWDIEGHALIHTLKGHETAVRTVAFSIDGWYIASGSSDGCIVVWDVEVVGPVRILKAGNSVERLRFSADGLFLVAEYRSWGSTMYAQWSAQNFSEYYRQSLTKKEAKQVLPDSPADGVPPSGTYLARDKGSQWVEKRCPGSTVERLCHLPQHDITGSASFGRYFVFGTTRGMYWLDFPPETFDITSTTVYTDSYMFDSDSDSDSD